MRVTFPRRQIVTALLLPFFAVAALGATNGALLLCEMQGFTQACCCKHETVATTNCAALSRASCCQSADTVSASLPSIEHRQLSQLQLPLTTLIGERARSSESGHRLVAVARNVPVVDVAPRSTTGPPLFIKHRALLI